MPRSEILAQIKDIMIDVFDVDDMDVTEATSAETVEAWDSLQHLRLLVAIERKFGVTFDNSEIEGLDNVGDLVSLVEKKTA